MEHEHLRQQPSPTRKGCMKGCEVCSPPEETELEAHREHSVLHLYFERFFGGVEGVEGVGVRI